VLTLSKKDDKIIKLSKRRHIHYRISWMLF